MKPAMANWAGPAVLTLVFVLTAGFAAPAVSAERVGIAASQKWHGRAFELRGQFYRPAGRARAPAVILMHGCGGLGASVRAALDAHARNLVRNGFAALVLDSFGSRGIPGDWVCRSLNRLAEARHYRLADARDAIRWLKSRPDIDSRNLFLMGQSNGGSVALRAAAAGGVRAVAAYYPWCGAASANRVPLIVFGGGKDDWVPPDECGRRRQSKRYRFVLYDAAAHSFDVKAATQSYLGHRIGYDARATADSRRRMVAFFRQHMR